MRLNQKLTQQCPCCNEKITFKELFKAWSLSSKNNKLVKCEKCQKPIQELAIYEKHGLIGALPLFAVPMIFENPSNGYIVGLLSLIYGLLLFWMLYILIHLKCLDESSKKDKIT